MKPDTTTNIQLHIMPQEIQQQNINNIVAYRQRVKTQPKLFIGIENNG